MRRLTPHLPLVPLALLAGGAERALPANQTIDLCATTGLATLPGHAPVPIWGVVHKGAAPDCSDVAGTATLPGPLIRVAKGDTVTLNVTNRLAAGHRLVLDIPGID